MRKLPPYGRSIDNSQDTIFIWAGFKRIVYQYVKAWGKNTLAFFPWVDSQSFYWPVSNRNVVIVHFMADGDEWIDRLALSLHLAGASQVVAIKYRPHGDSIGEENVTFTHY